MKKNQMGISLIEVMFSVIFIGATLVAVVSLTRGVVKGHVDIDKKTEALKLGTDALNMILTHPWEEALNDDFLKDKGIMYIPLSLVQPIGFDDVAVNSHITLDNSEIRDDIDDYDTEATGWSLESDEKKVTARVRFVNVPKNGDAVTLAPNQGLGTGGGTRTHHKYVEVTVNYLDDKGATQEEKMGVVVSNGTAGGLR